MLPLLILSIKSLGVILISMLGFMAGYDNKWGLTLFCAFLIYLITN